MRLSRPRNLAICALSWVCLFAGANPQDPELGRIAAHDLRDFQATVKVLKANRTELNKINRDFAMAYSLRDLTMRYKEPDKLRMEGSIGRLVLNGSSRLFKVPLLKLNQKDDLGASPGKRYTLFDIGVLTPSALSAMVSRFMRTEAMGSTSAQVFEVTYKGDETARFTVWVDPVRRAVLKRVWFDGSGKLKATFIYQDHQQLGPMFWAPTKLEIRNAEGVVAGVTTYSDIKINQGLDDSLFDVS